MGSSSLGELAGLYPQGQLVAPNNNGEEHKGQFMLSIRIQACALVSGKVETIQIHHLGPGSHEVPHESLLRIAARVHLRKSAELGV